LTIRGPSLKLLFEMKGVYIPSFVGRLLGLLALIGLGLSSHAG
jgi:hypothetical protein